MYGYVSGCYDFMLMFNACSLLLMFFFCDGVSGDILSKTFT